MTFSSHQIHLVEHGIKFGFSDAAIAKQLGLKYTYQVFSYRKKCGITADQVFAARLRTWASLVANNTLLEKRAQTYGLKNPRTLRVQLWKAGFSWETMSFTDLTQEQKDAVVRLAKKGIPDDEMAKMINAKPFQIALYRADNNIENKSRNYSKESTGKSAMPKMVSENHAYLTEDDTSSD